MRKVDTFGIDLDQLPEKKRKEIEFALTIVHKIQHGAHVDGSGVVSTADYHELEKQRVYILKIMMEPCPCSACGKPAVPVFCSDDKMLVFDSTVVHPDDAYHCLECGSQLVWVLPFVGGWHWELALNPHTGEPRRKGVVARPNPHAGA